MRIVAGNRKGTRIFAPKGDGTRPTSDRVREALFSILGTVDGAAVLDLFAGSGALGFEALSRGAESAVFVDVSRDAVKTIGRNADKLAFDDVTSVVRADVARFLATETRTFDLIFVDPPYELVESLGMPLAEHLPRVLAPGGLLAFESAGGLEPELPLPTRTTRLYGATRVTVFEHE